MWYYFNLQRLKEAEVEADIILKANPQDKNAAEVKGRIALNMNNIQEARYYFDKLIKNYPNNPLGYYWTGVTFLKEKKYKQSFKYLNQAYTINPDNPTLAGALYDLGLLTKNNKIISDLYNSMIDSDKSNIKALGYIYKAEHCLRDNNLNEAIQCYNSAINLAPNNTPYYLYLSKTYSRQNKYKEAIKVLLKANKISRDNKFVLFELAYAYFRDNNIKASEKIFKHIVEKYPTWVLPIINLSQILSEQTGKQLESIELAKKAASITPNSYLSRYNLGEIYFINKNYPMAMEEFKAALKYKPNDTDSLEYCRKINSINASASHNK